MSELEQKLTESILKNLGTETRAVNGAIVTTEDSNTIQIINATTEMIRKTAPNPKDLIGAKKVDISLLPQIAVIHGAHAMMDGAKKYGPYNWRDYDVEARTYVAAAMRHLQSWLEREEFASDSDVHHLGHAIACCAILLDAQANDCLIDNRPKKNQGYHTTVNEMNAKIKAKNEGKKENENRT